MLRYIKRLLKKRGPTVLLQVHQVPRLYSISDPKRMKAYEDPDGPGHLIGLMLADSCRMLLTDAHIKRYRKDIHELVDETIDWLEKDVDKKDYTTKNAKT